MSFFGIIIVNLHHCIPILIDKTTDETIKKMKKTTILFLLSAITATVMAQPSWPTSNAECKAGLRWWWPGSAVDADNIAWNLEQYAKAGAGSVEITPIYGV